MLTLPAAMGPRPDKRPLTYLFDSTADPMRSLDGVQKFCKCGFAKLPCSNKWPGFLDCVRALSRIGFMEKTREVQHLAESNGSDLLHKQFWKAAAPRSAAEEAAE